MHPYDVPSRFFGMFLLLALVFVALSTLEAAAAPLTSCESYSYGYTCPAVGSNGYVLINDSYAVLPDGPYSIFDCVYGKPNTPTTPYTCHYYKVSGEYALGPDYSPCPRQAPTCSDAGAPRFSAPEKVELWSWVENGKYMLWMREHHT